MKEKSVRTRWPGPEYHVRAVFRAPLAYAFAWCTDYSPIDSKLEGERYLRKVIRRGRHHVLFEDLENSPGGWSWARYDVTLQPPDRWHMESRGTHSQVIADYRLAQKTDGRTQFDLWWRRQPGLLEFTKRGKAEGDRSGALSWKRFAVALDRDYRRSRR
jgi:hypothetical protein